MEFTSWSLHSPFLLFLFLINVIFCASINGKSQNTSTSDSVESGSRDHFYYIPSIVEIELGLLNELVRTGPNVKLAEPGFSFVSFDQVFFRFLVRISCISHEAGEKLKLLSETARHIHERNRNVNDSSQHIELFLSIFHGFQNDSKYNRNLLHIKQVSDSFPGTITYILLDLSSVDIGPLDGFSLTQKWMSCNNVGVISGFTCGFVFDKRIFPSKASTLGFLQLAPSSQVFLQESENSSLSMKQYDRPLVDTVHALFRNELKFGGLLINNKVTVNDTHFYIQRLEKQWKYRSAPAIYRVVNNFTDEARIFYKKELTSYSKLSGNHSRSVIISITASNLLPLLTGRVNLHTDTDEKYSFMQLFSRFYVLVSSNRSRDENTSLPMLLSAVLNFKETNNATYHLQPLRLWIGFTPEIEIENELNAVVNEVAQINEKLPGTVEAVVLDYNHLRVDYQTVSVVKKDVATCNQLASANGFKCGFIFHQRNCFENSALLTSVPFLNGSIILLRGEDIGLHACQEHFRNFNLGFAPLATPGKFIEANFQDETFDYSAEDFDYIETLPTLYVPWLVRTYIPQIVHFDELLSIKDWLQKPTVFSPYFISFTVNVNDINSTDLVVLATKHNHLTVVINDLKRDDLHKLARCCSDYSTLVRASGISILLMYSPDIAYDSDSFDRLKSAITMLTSKCGQVISEVVINWNQCNSYESCFYAEPGPSTDNHFDGISNVTHFVHKLRSLNVNIGLVTSRKTWILLSYVAGANTTVFEHIKETFGTTDLTRNINTGEVLKIAQQFDKFVFEHTYDMTTIQIVGAYLAARHVVATLEDIASSGWINIESAERISFKLNIIECQYGNSWNGSVQYVRFLEILNNWAVIMEYKIIIDFLYDPYSIYNCGNNSDSSYHGGYGFWSRDKFSGELVDRKSQLKLFFDEQTKETRNTSVGDKTTTDTLLMLILIPFAFLISSLLVLFVIKSYQKRYVLSIEKTRELRHQMVHIPQIFVEICKKIPESLLGRGNSKTVIRKGATVVAGSRTMVAVKDFTAINDRGRISGEDFSILRGLISEANIMQDLEHHTNIIKFYGVCKEKLREGKLQLIVEYGPMGSLVEFLKALKSSDLSPDKYANIDRDMALDSAQLKTTMLRWSVEIASGLEYLASKRIVHGDIAARNILLGDGLCCKICDFGLSKRLENYEYYIRSNQESLPWRWMAPESLRKQIFNEKTDVWMYGITLWEIYTLGEVPYGGLAWSNEFLRMLEGGLRPELPISMPKEVIALVTNCLDVNSERRPTFTMVKSSLNGRVEA